MGDQPPLRIDHVGVAALAHLDLGDHVPDQLEVDLGDAHAGVAAGASKRERHVGLGFAAEIDRPVIDLAGDRLGEFRILGIVRLACHHVHGEPRDPQLLLAGGVELRQLGDGRNLPQQAKPVEPPLLDGAGRPRQLRGPADLAFDLLDELADLAGRRFRLLALDADQGRPVFAVGEPDLEQTIAQQRHAYDGKEQRHVFAE